MKKLFLVLVILLFSFNASAGWKDKEGNILPDTDDRKSAGDFGAQLIFSTNDEALFDRWATPSETVNLESVDSVQINSPISSFIIFSGCKANNSGNCNVSMRFRVIQPDGGVYAETPTMEVWQDKPAPTGYSLQLSADYLKIVIEPHEQRGRYVVQAQVRDDNTGTVIFLQKSFTASDGKRNET